MSIRQTALAFVLAAATVPAAFANSGATWVGGEIGFADHPVTSQRTREQVQQEYQAFRNHPVAADGAVYVGGELGWVTANQGIGFDHIPAGPHTHVLGNTGTPAGLGAAPLTEAERRAYREQYIN